MLDKFIGFFKPKIAELSTLPTSAEYSRLVDEFQTLGIELEQIGLFKHPGPVLETLQTIKQSGLLDKVSQIKQEYGTDVQSIVITPILPMTGRWEVTGDAFDRLFVCLAPKIYDEVYEFLHDFGFKRGVQNSNVHIMQKDFPRPEKMPPRSE